MSKTQYPLNILVAPSLVDSLMVKIQEWKDVGHAVETDCNKPWYQHDLVLGPNVWLMTKDHVLYVDMAIEAAQKRAYPVEKRRKKQ